MHVLNLYNKDNAPCCVFARGSKELESYVNMVYRDGFNILNIIPLNHILSGGTKYIRLIVQDNNSSDVLELPFVNFYDLDNYIHREDITILRVFPI